MSESSEEEEVTDSLLFAVCFIGNQLHKVLQPVSVFFMEKREQCVLSIHHDCLSALTIQEYIAVSQKRPRRCVCESACLFPAYT